MPQIPDFAFTRNGPVSGAPTPTEHVQATPEAFGGGAAAGGEALAQGVYKAAMLQAQYNNTAAVNEGQSNLLQKMNTILSDPNNGYLTKIGKNATDAFQPTLEALKSAQDEEADKMPSPMARNQYLETSNWAIRSAERTASYHAAEQQRVYWTQSAKAEQQSTMDFMSLNYNNEQVWKEGMEKLVDNQAQIDQRNGVSEAVGKQNVQNLMSAASTLRVSRWADQDPKEALAWYQAHPQNFTMKDSLHLDNMFRTTMKSVYDDQQANHFIFGGGAANLDSAWNLNKQLESGGKQSAINTSVLGKTSFGVSQIQESTARMMAHKLNIPYDPALLKANTPEGKAYNEKLGRAYFSDLYENYSGDAALAGMAYVAGQGGVDKWIAQFGDPRTGSISDADFIAKVRAAGNPQTAARGEKMLEAAHVSGFVPTDSDPRTHEAEIINNIQQAYGDDPRAKDVIQAARTKIATIGKQIDAQRRQSYNTLLTVISGGPGGDQQKVLSEAQIMQNPEMKSEWLQLTQTQRNELSNQMYNESIGKHDMTEEGLKNYYMLKGMAQTDPAIFTAQDISKYPGMNLSAQQRLIEQQQVIAKKPAGSAFLGHALKISKALTDNFSDITKDKAKYNEFVGRLEQEIDTFQGVHGRLPNDADIRKMVPEMTKTTLSGMWPFRTSQYGFEQPYKSLIEGVPDQTAKDISLWYRRKFNKDPTSAELTWWYQQLQGKK